MPHIALAILKRRGGFSGTYLEAPPAMRPRAGNYYRNGSHSHFRALAEGCDFPGGRVWARVCGRAQRCSSSRSNGCIYIIVQPTAAGTMSAGAIGRLLLNHMSARVCQQQTAILFYYVVFYAFVT